MWRQGFPRVPKLGLRMKEDILSGTVCVRGKGRKRGIEDSVRFQFLLACVSPSFWGKQPLLCLQDYDYVESKRLHPSRPFNLPDPESLAMNFRIILFFILKKEEKKVEERKKKWILIMYIRVANESLV